MLLSKGKLFSGRGKGEDDTSSLKWLKDTDSQRTTHTVTSHVSSVFDSGQEFAFDDDVLQSKPYRATVKTIMQKDTSSPPTTQSQLSGPAAVVENVRMEEDRVHGSNLRPESLSIQVLLMQLDRRLTDLVMSNNQSGLEEALQETVSLSFPSRWFPWSLRCAIDISSIPSIKILLGHGVQLESIDGFSRTPFSYACSRGQAEVAEYLFERGANIETRNIIGESPLHAACCLKDSSIVKKLLDWGANTHCRDLRGDTPLHCACSLGSGDVITALLDYGATFSVPHSHGVRKSHAEFLVTLIVAEEGAICEADGGDLSYASVSPIESSISRLHALIACLSVLLSTSLDISNSLTDPILERSSLLKTLLVPHFSSSNTEKHISLTSDADDENSYPPFAPLLAYLTSVSPDSIRLYIASLSRASSSAPSKSMTLTEALTSQWRPTAPDSRKTTALDEKQNSETVILEAEPSHGIRGLQKRGLAIEEVRFQTVPVGFAV